MCFSFLEELASWAEEQRLPNVGKSAPNRALGQGSLGRK
jgi:hypothetical protein